MVPNDDGYGPSALGYYVAKVLLRAGHSLVVRNESALSLNASFYKDEINKGRVSLQPAFGGIRMRKTAGGVDVPGTLEDARTYPEFSNNYFIPEDVDAVIDVGTPAAVRAAREARKPVFTIFDHSWGKTYEKTLENFVDNLASTLDVKDVADFVKLRAGILSSPSVQTSLVGKAIERMKQDESKTAIVFLFDSYIAPKPFHEHWRSLGVPIEPIGGVFGGMNVSRQEARKRMGISETDPEKSVYVLGGGTPVWDAKLAEINARLKDKVLKYNVVLFDRNAKPNDYQRLGNNVHKGGAVAGETVQGLLPGVDLVLTRAGGGIVNDAIACRVPFVCVEEPNHWQVEMIRQNCEHEGLTRTIRFADFRDRDIEQLISQHLIAMEAENDTIRMRMKDISNGMEQAVAETIIKSC